jgi:aspartyl-tRNA synthetase
MNVTVSAMKRTDYCGTLRKKDVGRVVTLAGWVHRRRDHGALLFIDLRDREGSVQIVFDLSSPSNPCVAFEKEAHALRSEYVISVTGNVCERTLETENKEIPTGQIEVHVTKLTILNSALTPPFSIEEDKDIAETLRLQYRYLDLRRPSVKKNFLLRHQLAQATRHFLDQSGFIDIETPMLTKSTPEGARDFLVPSRLTPGSFYALPQSPQLFKQILMVAGFDRYYQIVRCFRDEDLRADRQPEFTQIDIEMSFIEQEDLMGLMEKMVADLFVVANKPALPLPFPQMTYQDSMNRFGVDKPDLRFGLELKEITDLAAQSQFKVFLDTVNKTGVVKGINAKTLATLSRKEMDDLTQEAITRGAKGLAWLKVTPDGIESPIAKFFTKEILDQITGRLEAVPGDLLLFVADTEKKAHEVLGSLRLLLGQRLKLIDPNSFKPVWITDFPLLEYDPEEKRYVALHHPFTAPLDEDIPLLSTDPLRVRSKAYDLALNGTEVGGGSIRIHQTEMQSKIFNLLGITEEEANAKFGFLLEALGYGAPPHGGIAFGLDRFVAILAGCESIRDVIAFPKTQKGVCLMTQAPSTVDAMQLKTLSIQSKIQ